MDELTLVSGEGSIGGRSPAAPPVRELPRGTTVGRYVVVDVIGRGAMGVVHAAYDPELDRKVALKLVRAGRSKADDSIGRSQTLREAQAMARLQHPNTVAVYDVGTHGEQVFLTMELVTGGTLTQWLASKRRSWREIVDVFVQAGRGLGAAHAAGIVHRDFKPDNVLVSDEGASSAGRRVVVTDFGLARGLAPTDSEQPLEISGSAVDLRLTRTGRIAGTPAYMAPEVVSGRGADARSDQFSYCVALYEALYGVRPFEGETLAALVLALTEGRVREPPADRRVPAFVRRAVLRGLTVNPDDRFRDVQALLQALLADPGRRARRMFGGATVLAMVGGAAAFGYAQASRAQRCDDATSRLRGIWDASRRADVEQAITATGVVFAGDTANRVLDALDRYAAAWSQQANEACEDARKVPAAEEHGRRGLCLTQRRAELNALVDVLAHADAAVVERATQAVERLGSVEVCRDPGNLVEFSVPQDLKLATEVDGVRTDLVRARALYATGRRLDAIDVTTAAVEAARSLAYEPLIAEALATLGYALSDADPIAAVDHLRQAYWLALGHGADAVALQAAIRLVFVLVEAGRYEPGHDWAAHAEALLRRAGADPQRQMELDLNVARLLIVEARFDEALAKIRRTQDALNLDSPLAIHVFATLADVFTQRGEYAAAIPVYEDALRRAEQAYGPWHPTVLALVNNLAIVRYEQGDFEAARAELSRALLLADRIWGPERLSTAALINNLASTLERLDRYEEAIMQHERAFELRTALTGPDSLDVAESHNNLGAVQLRLNELEKARFHHERALEIRQAALGSEHPLYAASLANTAMVALDLGDHADARARLERALAIQEAALGAKHSHLVDTLDGLAHASFYLRDWDAAERVAERALSIGLDGQTSRRKASLLFLLAKTLRVQKKQPDRARALAEQARSLLEHDAKGDKGLLAEIDRFLARNR